MAWSGSLRKARSPDPIVSWITSASLAALNKKDGKHRPVAVEHAEAFTAKATLTTATEDMTLP